MVVVMRKLSIVAAMMAGVGGALADCSTGPFEEINLAKPMIDLMFDGRYLGFNGARIEAGNFQPQLLEKDGKVHLSPVWPAQVDWSVYQQSGKKAPGTQLTFKRTADGSRHLCRVTDRISNEEDGDSKVMDGRVFQYRYGSAGRLEEVAERDAAGEGHSYCYLYDASGFLSARVMTKLGQCEKTNLTDADPIYVHDETGRLLRKIYLTPGAHLEDIPRAERATWVLTYDAHGKQHNAYFNPQIDEPLKLPAFNVIGTDNSSSYAVIAKLPWYLRLMGKEEARHIPPEKWRFVRINSKYFGQPVEWSKEAEIEVIASGKTDTEGVISMTKAQQRKLLARVRQYPGEILLRSTAFSKRIFVAPAISLKQWEACADPSQRTEVACE